MARTQSQARMSPPYGEDPQSLLRLAPRTLIPLLLGSILGATVLPAQGQDVKTITSEPMCPTCSIELEHVASLGRPGDPVSLMRFSKVAVDGQGRFFVAPTFNAGEIAMYDADGSFVKTFGRLGQGPGEFSQGIIDVRVGPGDTVHVFEVGRHTTISPALEQFVAVQQLAAVPQYAVILRDGRVVISSRVPGLLRRREPIHVLNAQGEFDRSFGGSGIESHPDELMTMVRALALASSGRIWSAHLTRYRMDLWGTDGSHYSTVIRHTDWFRPWSRQDPREPFTKKPRPRIESLWEDSEGRLWVSVWVADERWKPLLGFRGHVPAARIPNLRPYFDSVLEVLDLREGRVVARTRFDRILSRIVGAAGLVSEKREDADGNIAIDVWRVRIGTP